MGNYFRSLETSLRSANAVISQEFILKLMCLQRSNTTLDNVYFHKVINFNQTTAIVKLPQFIGEGDLSEIINSGLREKVHRIR